MADLRVVLVGCGGMGRGLVGQLDSIPGVRLVGGVDPDEGARGRLVADLGVPAWCEWESALAECEFDAVIVAPPNHCHLPCTLAAAAAGKHVFCEKPMAGSMADCRAMIDACASRGLKLQIGQVLRYIPDFAKAIEMAEAGELGQLKYGTIFRYGPPKPHWDGTWRDDPAKVWHHLFEVSVHEIDFMRCVFGKPVAVTGWDFVIDPASPLWSVCTTAVVEFEGGAVCTLNEGMYNAIGRAEVEISGTEGAVRFQWGTSFTYRSHTGREPLDLTGEQVSANREYGLRREIREWVEAIAEDKPCTIPGEEGMANIELTLAILESARRKQRITLPLE
jgi:predicted dehydrogenase